MLFLTLFALAVVTICAFTVWTRPDGSPLSRRRTTAARQPGAKPESPAESLEGVLIAQLMAGEITRAQYLRAVEGLAARDHDRHPLSVPPDNGPAAA